MLKENEWSFFYLIVTVTQIALQDTGNYNAVM